MSLPSSPIAWIASTVLAPAVPPLRSLAQRGRSCFAWSQLVLPPGRRPYGHGTRFGQADSGQAGYGHDSGQAGFDQGGSQRSRGLCQAALTRPAGVAGRAHRALSRRLLAQTLVASTYPLEIVQLQQWLAKNPKLKDKALADSVAKQPWDPSIQSMAARPRRRQAARRRHPVDHGARQRLPRATERGDVCRPADAEEGEGEGRAGDQ